MKARRPISRRSFLVRVAGTALAGGAAMKIFGGEARAAQGSPGGGKPTCSDVDEGPDADPYRGGRSGLCRRRTGVTDQDSGPDQDRAEHGRGTRTGVTDRDVPPGADPAEYGRGPAGEPAAAPPKRRLAKD